MKTPSRHVPVLIVGGSLNGLATALLLGQRYEIGALIPEDDAPSRAFEPARELSGRPGTRAPHLPIVYRGKEGSTLDLFGNDFVVLTGSSGESWREAASALNKNGLVPLVVHCIASDGEVRPVTDSWGSAYGLDENGAVLVRPDGFVAWRSRGGLPENPSAALAEVFHSMHIFANDRAAVTS